MHQYAMSEEDKESEKARAAIIADGLQEEVHDDEQ